MTDHRIERDSMGEMQVPADALYGPQTARALENFRISGWPMPRQFIAAVGLIKLAAARANKLLGRLEPQLADAIEAAATEVVQGKLDEQFPVDVFQTGSGTSTNMNANEVIANRASQILGGSVGEYDRVHPNDHVNMGQSSNDVIPSAVHVSAAMAIAVNLRPMLMRLRQGLWDKVQQYDDIIKIGRTHLMDAVPIRLGQEFSGWAAQVDQALDLLSTASARLVQLPLGGTAVGTGLNTSERFSVQAIAFIAESAGLPFIRVANRFAAQGAKDAAVFASGTLRTAALALGKIASDVRLLGSGPRCGLGELHLPAIQPGSSIMPGKVNPVICESVVQVACQVVGCDAAIAAGATGGVGSILQLNVAMPMIALNLLTAINLLANASGVFLEKCIAGIEPDRDRCEQLVERSLAMVTSLAPELGYDRAAELAKQAHAENKTIREVCSEAGVLSPERLDELLDPTGQTGE